jgi:hypothetical protein
MTWFGAVSAEDPMLQNFVTRYSTPLTTGLFLVSLVSGVALFFHVGNQYFRGMHEWLSMLLVLPFALHVWKNWGPLVNYLRRGWMLAPLGLSLAAAIVFAAPAMISPETGAGGNPMMVMSRVLAEARVGDLATMMKTTPDKIVARLEAAGLGVVSAETTIAAAATAAGKDARQVVLAVVSGR